MWPIWWQFPQPITLLLSILILAVLPLACVEAAPTHLESPYWKYLRVINKGWLSVIFYLSFPPSPCLLLTTVALNQSKKLQLQHHGAGQMFWDFQQHYSQAKYLDKNKTSIINLKCRRIFFQCFRDKGKQF